MEQGNEALVWRLSPKRAMASEVFLFFPHACCLSETGWLSWLQAQSDLFSSLILSSTSPSLWIPGSPGWKRGRSSVFTHISVRGDKEGDRVGLWDSQTQCLPQDFTSGPYMR